MWLKDPEDLHQNQLQDHQNHPQDQRKQCCPGTRLNTLKHPGFSLQTAPFILVSSYNFKRLVSAPTALHRHQTKTPESYPIGFDFDLDMVGFCEALRAPKREKLLLQT